MKNDTLRIIGACTVGAFALIGAGYVVAKKLTNSKTHYCHCSETMTENSNECDCENHTCCEEEKVELEEKKAARREARKKVTVE